jgi:hypothetical protein
MKLLLETWKKYLTEICGDTDPYDFKFHNQFSDGDVHFEFETDTGSQYYVNFTQGIGPRDEVPWEISFDVDDSIEMTGENEPLKIMSTVVAVIKEFIDTPEYNKGHLKFVFEGTRKPEELIMPLRKATARTKLYLKCLEKFIPEGCIEVNGNIVKFEVPPEGGTCETSETSEGK